MNNHIKKCYEEIKFTDSLTDIKMFDYFYANYKNARLFQYKNFPTSLFLFELAQKIMKLIGVKNFNFFYDMHFAEHKMHPIPKYWYEHCEFTFENNCYIHKNILVEEYEWYYLLLTSEEPDYIDGETKLSQLRNEN
jgi:hypothetical protein